MSTNLTSTSQLFDVSEYPGLIDTYWVNVNNTLYWDSDSFADGTAYFCREADDDLWVLFGGPENPAYPQNCTLVMLLAIPSEYALVLLYAKY